MKITVDKTPGCEPDAYEITGLPAGEYDLTVTAVNALGNASTTVHESIAGPAPQTPVAPAVEA